MCAWWSWMPPDWLWIPLRCVPDLPQLVGSESGQVRSRSRCRSVDERGAEVGSVWTGCGRNSLWPAYPQVGGDAARGEPFCDLLADRASGSLVDGHATPRRGRRRLDHGVSGFHRLVGLGGLAGHHRLDGPIGRDGRAMVDASRGASGSARFASMAAVRRTSSAGALGWSWPVVRSRCPILRSSMVT